MKTEVIITSDSPDKDYKKGDIGYIDGYIRGGDNIPYAVVVLTNKTIVMVPFHDLEARREYNFYSTS